MAKTWTKSLLLFSVTAASIILLLYSGCETSETLTRKRIKSVERSLLETVSIKGMPLKKMDYAT